MKDYYTQKPLPDQTVVLKLCHSAPSIYGAISCDSIASRKTNNQGFASFRGTLNKPIGSRNFHHVCSRLGNGYAWSNEIEAESPNTTILAKPLVPVDLTIKSSIPIDSLFIEIIMLLSPHDNYIPPPPPPIDQLSIVAMDSISTQIKAAAEEDHTIITIAFMNDSIVWEERDAFYANQGSGNALRIEK